MRTPHCFLSLRPSSAIISKLPHQSPLGRPALTRISQQPKRQFLSTPLTPEIQSLKASRTLSYPANKIYDLIADISSYSTFLPYCSSSTITSWSDPDPTSGKKWPQEAELKVGWAGYDETFRSKVFCVPGSVVEAVSGEARTTIAKDDIPHHSKTLESANAEGNAMFTSLLTTWRLREFPFKPPPPEGKHGALDSSQGASPVPQTEVNLSIEVQFASPVYAALSKAAAPKVAGVLIDAFEKRAKEVLGKERERPGQSAEKAEKVEQDSGLEGAIGGTGMRESQ
ncbi:MAG: hypothetical protein M1830_007002 [Pleopsidium flavum]|nr:MAG: hypothetical protein M1830_007002 [Pleopsidium flavum]